MGRKLTKALIKKFGISKEAWSHVPKTKTLKRIVTKKSVVRMAARRRVTRAKKRCTRRAGGLLKGLGRGLSVKSLVAGTAGLILTERYQPFGGAYKPAIDKIAIGIVGPMAGLDNQDMLTVGVKEGLATLIGGYLGGAVKPGANGSVYL